MTSDAGEAAVEIGLRDTRIASFLGDREYTVSGVESEPTPEGHDGARVVNSLAQVAPLTEWLEDVVCSIDRESDDITGVVWLVDLEEGPERESPFVPHTSPE